MGFAAIPVRTVVRGKDELHMQYDRDNERRGAIGWAFLVWLFGGGLGLAILVFIILKMIGG